ncbi:MAG: hypothetical protein CMJ36_01890 [Phycisphaerae bacterium]|nr:hypothetical protein [Phycisphaerae bacterium]
MHDTPPRLHLVGGSSDGEPMDLGTLGDAIVLVVDGKPRWSNPRFDDLSQTLREACISWCGTSEEPVRRTHLSEDGRHWEVLRAPAEGGAWLGMLFEVTDDRNHQLRRQVIAAAGVELLHLDRSTVEELNVAERLRLLEEKIVEHVRRELKFDNFEIRLLEPRTRQLELVIAENINPLKIGEVIYAEEAGNGISGWVAATGRSYRCDDVQDDPLYREGLDDAASTLTVPLRMHEDIIGVFNIESNSKAHFTEKDEELAELFGEYIAMAMHMLDLLVVERFTTSEQASMSLLSDLETPLQDISLIVQELKHDADEGDERLARLNDAIHMMRNRIQASAAGPRSILDAEQALAALEPVEALAGKRVIVADDEPNIRRMVAKILEQLGCEVMICSNGAEAIEQLEEVARADSSPDLLLSDIKMPDLNGYELFRESQDRFPGIPVILMTGFGYDPNHSIVRASQEGMQTVLFKPFKTSQLVDAVTKAVT